MSATFAERKAERRERFFRFEYGWKQGTCTACSGSGRYDNKGSPKCGACNGTGKERYKPVVSPAPAPTDERPCYRLGAVAYAKWHASEGYTNGISDRAMRESIQRASKYGRTRLGDVPDMLLSLKDYCAMRVRPQGVSQFLACRDYPLQMAVEDWVATRRADRDERRLMLNKKRGETT